MSAETLVLGASLGGLGVALAIVSWKGFAKYRAGRSLPQLMWGIGLAFGAAAMAVETVVYFGVVSEPLLQAYVFLSAAIVGALSLGSTRVLRNARFEQAYSGFMVLATGVVGVASFATPVPSSMVTDGVITGNPPLVLLLLSSVVTGPATVVLLASAVLSLRRSWRWQTLLMVAGAMVLGAGGAFYIASFPIVLYYAEFLGIGLLFLGILSLPQVAPAATPSASRAASGP